MERPETRQERWAPMGLGGEGVGGWVVSEMWLGELGEGLWCGGRGW